MTLGLRAGSSTALRAPVVPGPRVARASLPWAVLVAMGAQFLVAAFIEVLIVAIYPVLFPAPARPFSFSIRVFWESAGAVAAGAVIARAGGLRATLGYLLFQLGLLLLMVPVRLFSCSRSPVNQGPGSCDFVVPLLVTDRWPFWLALAIGVALARFVPLRAGGSNKTLRAAGVLSVFASVGASLSSLWLVYQPSAVIGPAPLVTYLSIGVLQWIGVIAGGALAGRVLVRSPLAAVMLLCLAIIGPSFALGVPLMRGQIAAPFISPFWLSVWSWAWLPLVASLAMVAAREIARRSIPVGWTTMPS